MIKRTHRNEFLRIADQLNNLMKEIQEYCPDANFYVAMETLHLMKGVSHDSQGKHTENSIESKSINSLSCGDW